MRVSLHTTGVWCALFLVVAALGLADSPHWPSGRAAGIICGLPNQGDSVALPSYQWQAAHFDAMMTMVPDKLDYIRLLNPTIVGPGRYKIFTAVLDGTTTEQAVEARASALGRDLEDAYLHYSRDTFPHPIRASYDVSSVYPWLSTEWDSTSGNYKVRVPGWNPANDRNGDGYVDDAEFATLVDANARARRKMHARIVNWSWSPPQWQVNLGAYDIVKVLVELAGEALDEPAANGQSTGYALMWWDSIDGWLWGGDKLEYPREVGGDAAADWQSDIARLVQYSKTLYGDSILIGGNCGRGYWTIDKELDVCIREAFTNTWDTWSQWEGLQPAGRYGPFNPNSAYFQARQDSSGKIQILQHQYNLLYYIADTPDVWARDRIFGVVAYYLLQKPEWDYWAAWRGYGYWPTLEANVKMWSKALEVDIGVPTGEVPPGKTAITPWGVWVLAEGADPGHPDYPDITKSRYKVYARQYTNGLVLLKPKSGYDSARSTFAYNTATTHDLGGWYQPVNDDRTLGEPTNSVTLRNGEAAVFVGGRPTVTLMATPSATIPGSDVTYVATCTNPFPDPITNVKMQGRIPADTTYVDGSARLVVGADPVDPITLQFAPNPDNPSELFIWVIVDQIPGGGGRAEFEYKVRLATE